MLGRYLSSLVATRLLGSLLGLAAILQLLDLLDQASTILTHAGIAGLPRYVGLRLPSLLAGVIPLAVLIGTLLAFLRLANTQETTAMRAAGVSLWRIMSALLPICLLVSAVQFALQAEYAPRSERAFSDWWAQTAPAASGADPAPARLWFRAHGDIAAIDGVATDGDRLTGVLIIERSPAGDLLNRLDAASADFAGGRWVLHDVRVTSSDGAGPRMRTTMDWPHGPPPENMVELARPVESQTLGHLLAVLHGTRVGLRGRSFYRTQRDALLAALLDPLVMLALAAPVLLAPPRTGVAGPRIIGGIGLGLLYLAAAGFLAALGGASLLPPFLAGWTAPAVFGLYAGLRMLQAEEA